MALLVGWVSLVRAFLLVRFRVAFKIGMESVGLRLRGELTLTGPHGRWMQVELFLG